MMDYGRCEEVSRIVADPSVVDSSGFLEWLQTWMTRLPAPRMAEVIGTGGDPSRVAVFCVDMTRGFCREGALASSRVAGIIGPVVNLLNTAYASGVRQFILPQDAHPADSPEFEAWPPHCIAGTPQAETIPEIADLPFAALLHVVPKQSVSSSIETSLDDVLTARLIETAICVGDCTDICIYLLAMHLRLRANANRSPLQVIVPANCVQTYDLPVDQAAQIGALPHPGDLLHALFLYHMALNGIQVVKSIQG